MLDAMMAGYATAGGPGYLMREGPLVAPLLRLAVARDRHAGPVAAVLRLLGVPAAAAPAPPAPLPAPPGRVTVRPGDGAPVVISPREQEVLRLLATGASNRAIAAQLVIGEQTVKTHLINLFRKLDVTSRTGAVQRARDLGLI